MKKNLSMTEEQQRKMQRIEELVRECLNALDAAKHARSHGRYLAAKAFEAEADELQDKAIKLALPESKG